MSIAIINNQANVCGNTKNGGNKKVVFTPDLSANIDQPMLKGPWVSGIKIDVLFTRKGGKLS